MIMKMAMTTTMAMTMAMKINKKYFFNNIQKRVITCSIDKKSYKKQKKDVVIVAIERAHGTSSNFIKRHQTVTCYSRLVIILLFA